MATDRYASRHAVFVILRHRTICRLERATAGSRGTKSALYVSLASVGGIVAKIGTAQVEIKPVLNEEALTAITERIESEIREAVRRGMKASD